MPVLPEQTSDISEDVSPVGDTRRMSTSEGRVWLRPRSVTLTSVITPDMPDTSTVDGNGDALPLLGIVIAASLVKVRVMLALLVLVLLGLLTFASGPASA